ncbi:heavy-metal-associated domain-containing protein [Chitinophaga deserti]|uniref:heavy-metal-associated domain-containing protein n=1 Tax=Chitinophaga deserti TaxID=2164099 RepID=UPI000D6C1973|nr:heavy-metal-associated domain-containing protein [Chitinophaga deserti]
MKKILSFLALPLSIFATQTAFGQSVKTDSFTVSGNCGMCKKRIEKAALIPGVTSAVWDVKAKTMTVKYDSATVKKDDVRKKIAQAGHDSGPFKATDSVYQNLPGCCRYERN